MSYHVDRPRGMSPRAFARRQANSQRDPIIGLRGVIRTQPITNRNWHSKKRAAHRDLIAAAREMTGRSRMGWKATKKFARRLERRTK